MQFKYLKKLIIWLSSSLVGIGAQADLSRANKNSTEIFSSRPHRPDSVSSLKDRYQISLSTESLLSPKRIAQGEPGPPMVNPFVGLVGQSYSGLLRFDVEGQYQPAAPVLSYFNFRDAFLHFDVSTLSGESPVTDAELTLSVGRQRYNWFSADEDWHLGLFQPRFRWNPVSAQQQGLAGLFIESRVEQRRLTLAGFASPMFIPDQGSGYVLQNGKFVQINPWFSYPPAQARFAKTGAVDSIRYDVIKPDFDEIAFQPSVVGMVRYETQPESAGTRNNSNGNLSSLSAQSKKAKNWFVQTSYADKPAPHLLLGLDGFLTAGESVEIQIHPTSFRHRVWAAEMGVMRQGIGGGLRVASEQPYSPNIKPEINYELFGSSTVLNPYLEWRHPQYRLELQGVWLEESDSTFVGPKPELKKSLEASRYQMRSFWALQGELDGATFGVSKLELQLSYLESFDSLDSRIRLKADWVFSPLWLAFLEGVLVRGEGSPSQRRTIFETFNDQDTAWMGVRYAF